MKLHLIINKKNEIVGYQTFPLHDNAIEITDKQFEQLEKALPNKPVIKDKKIIDVSLKAVEAR